MCGLLASFNNFYSKEKLDESLSLMDHRGPDFSSSCIGEGYYLGHNRLSIIDTNPRSNQPFEKDDHILLFNGEVYNYVELIKDHKLKIKTSSDTEVILEMYFKFKEKCVEYFNGMFSFVIYNKITKDIFVARDRLGIKPLYYHQNGKSIIYSSEIAPILNLKSQEFDDFGVRQYRKLRMTIKGYTVYKNIKMFDAGYTSLNGKLKKYWNLELTKKPNPSDEELMFEINKSIKLRKRSDVPVGSYLSGGLDSTIVSTILKPNHTWTVGFESLNEFEWGEIANKSISSEFFKINVTRDEFLETLPFMVKKRKEPLSVPNEIMIYLMTKKVKEKNTVVLSGEGADELFFGYDKIFTWAQKTKKISYRDFDKYYCYGTNEDDEVIDFALNEINQNSALDKIAYFFQIYHLHGLLRRLDNSTMLSSVEARVPFVDHNLIEMMSGTSYEWRMGKDIKSPLKRIFKNIIPKKIIKRKKIGFPAPIDKIFDSNFEGKTPMDKWLLYNLKTLSYKG